MGGIFKEMLGCADFNDGAVIHENNPVCDFSRIDSSCYINQGFNLG
jgi:hypothetical protein